MISFFDQNYHATYFDNNYFGVDATLTKTDNSTSTINGVFNEEHKEYVEEDVVKSTKEISFETTANQAEMGNQILIDSVNYKIIDIQTDNGIDKYILNKI